MEKGKATMERIGEYLLRCEIGRGGMAVIYEAVHAQTGAVVALKVLAGHLAHDPVFIQRFRHEAAIASTLRHPNIVPILDVGEAAGCHYLAMELIRGRSLAQILEQEPLLPPQLVAAVGLAVAQALDYAHSQGVVHRDIKPGNILIEGSGSRILLADFGIARAADTATITVAGAGIGTPAYMSPEQVRGERVDGRSDLYSLGAVLFRAAAGRLPFGGDSSLGILNQHLTAAPPILHQVEPGVPLWLSAIVNRCLVKQPELRYQRGMELATDLHRGLSGAFPATEARRRLSALSVTFDRVARAAGERLRSAGSGARFETPRAVLRDRLLSNPERRGKTFVLATTAIVLAVLLVAGSVPTARHLAGRFRDRSAALDVPKPTAGHAPVASVAPPPVTRSLMSRPAADRAAFRITFPQPGLKNALVEIEGVGVKRYKGGVLAFELPPGAYTMEFRADGCEPQKRRLDLAAGDERFFEVGLLPTTYWHKLEGVLQNRGVYRAWRYGAAVLVYRIGSQGEITSLKVHEATDDEVAERLARAIHEAQPYPAPPHGIPELEVWELFYDGSVRLVPDSIADLLHRMPGERFVRPLDPQWDFDPTQMGLLR